MLSIVPGCKPTNRWKYFSASRVPWVNFWHAMTYIFNYFNCLVVAIEKIILVLVVFCYLASLAVKFSVSHSKNFASCSFEKHPIKQEINWPRLRRSYLTFWKAKHLVGSHTLQCIECSRSRPCLTAAQRNYANGLLWTTWRIHSFTFLCFQVVNKEENIFLVTHFAKTSVSEFSNLYCIV